MKRQLLHRLVALRDDGGSAALVTDLGTGQHTLVHGDIQEGDCALPDDILALVRQAIARDKSGIIEENWFAQVVTPAPRLMVVGAVHIAQMLIPMAQQLGYAVTLIDPRQAFGSDSRFPGVSLRNDWPDDALTALKPDSRTAVVTLSHDPKIDDPALITALTSPAFYIGALGSRKTHEARVKRLQAAGLTDEQIGRLCAPVGLRIGAVSQGEIAVSILAELTAWRRGMQAG